MARNIGYLLLALILAAGCSQRVGSACADLGRLDPHNAAADAARALDAGEQSFLGVYGYRSEVPGLTEAQAREALQGGRVRMIAGTSDASPCSDLNERAIRYAQLYNAAIGRPSPH